MPSKRIAVGSALKPVLGEAVAVERLRDVLMPRAVPTWILNHTGVKIARRSHPEEKIKDVFLEGDKIDDAKALLRRWARAYAAWATDALREDDLWKWGLYRQFMLGYCYIPKKGGLFLGLIPKRSQA